jgi:hypothetical protein
MMRRRAFFVLLVCITCFGFETQARSIRNSLTGNPLDEESKKGQLSAKIPPTADRTRFDVSSLLTYSVRQDQAQPREPKSALHRLQATGTLTFLDRPVIKGFDDEFAEEIVTLALVVGGQMTTLANEIDATSGNGAAELSDIDFSASRSFPINAILGARSSLETSLGVSLPTSLASQYEAVRVVPYATLSWAMLFEGGRYGLTQTLSGDYIVNEYEYSPVSREINSMGSTGYSIAGTVRLGRGFRIRVGGNARVISYLDGTNTRVLSNVQSLSWTDGKHSVTASYSNGARAEDRETSMWFVDEYRRVISLALSVRF